MQIVKMTQAEVVKKTQGKKTGTTLAGSNTKSLEKKDDKKKPLKT